MNLTKKLFTGSALQTINLLFDIAIGFLMMPFLISNLGEKWYGLWLLIGSIMGFFGLLTIGLSSAVQQYLSRENSPDPDNIKNYNQTLNSALAVFGIASILAIFIALLFSFIPSLFVKDTELLHAFKYLIIIMGFNISISFISSPFRAVLAADYKFNIISFAELTAIITKTILTFLLVTLDFGVVAIAIATLSSNIFGKAILFFMSLKHVKKIQFGFSFIKKKKLIKLFSYGLKTFGAWIGDILRFSIDNIVITAFVGLSSVTVYNLPLRLFNYSSQFIITSLSVLQPFFSQRAGEGNNEDIKNKFELAYGISYALGGLLASGLFVFGYDFVNLWVGEYEDVKTLMYIMPAMILLATAQNPCLLILYAHNKHHYYAYQNIGEGVFNAIISLIAVQYYGIIGVALGSIVPMLVTKLILQPRLTCKLINYPLRKYYAQIAVCYIFVIIASALGSSFKGEINTFYNLVINALLFTVIFIPSYWFVALNKNTKAFFYLKLRSSNKS